MISRNKITGIILAGGKSSRMGKDKGHLKFRGKKFIQHSLDAIEPFVEEKLIVSNDCSYDVFGCRRVEDVIKDFGPVAGIYSGLINSTSEFNIILSCDIPLINERVVEKLLKSNDGQEIVLIESKGRKMPLIGLYKKQCEEKFKIAIEKGERKLNNVIEQCNVKLVELEDSEVIFTSNINTKEDLMTIVNEG